MQVANIFNEYAEIENKKELTKEIVNKLYS